jgi:general secretion pathway protein G
MSYVPVVSKPHSMRLRDGFTLIELMIALVIIGLITGGAIYFAMSYLENARRSSTRTTLQNFKVQILSYKTEKGEYPKSLQDLIAAGFLKKPLPKDGWDHNFVYRLTPDGKNPYELFSYGPQGKAGGKASRIDAWEK